MSPTHTVVILFIAVFMGVLPLVGADQAEREALRYNDAIVKLQQTRDENLANIKARAIIALTVIANNSVRAQDTNGTDDAYRAILQIDREHQDARKHFTKLGKLKAVLAELDAKPADLLGLDTGENPAKDTTVRDKPKENN